MMEQDPIPERNFWIIFWGALAAASAIIVATVVNLWRT